MKTIDCSKWPAQRIDGKTYVTVPADAVEMIQQQRDELIRSAKDVIRFYGSYGGRLFDLRDVVAEIEASK